MTRWARAASLQPEHMTGLTYNPLFKSYKLDDNDVSVNYMMMTSLPAES